MCDCYPDRRGYNPDYERKPTDVTERWCATCGLPESESYSLHDELAVQPGTHPPEWRQP